MSDLLSKIRELRALHKYTDDKDAADAMLFELLLNHLDEIEKALEEKRP